MARPTPSRRLIDIAFIAPIIGFVLLIPPLIGLFANAGEIFGAPVLLVYIFSVWLGLIAIAGGLAHRLGRAEKRDPE